ncbi:hypothetical protein D9O50_17980 [Oxalobacteraceae bacterium CAVE-383]|nr:hypothetical protein D9O50_17980 [Oxalobacteraceae bacterium CAVE-383]
MVRSPKTAAKGIACNSSFESLFSAARCQADKCLLKVKTALPQAHARALTAEDEKKYRLKFIENYVTMRGFIPEDRLPNRFALFLSHDLAWSEIQENVRPTANLRLVRQNVHALVCRHLKMDETDGEEYAALLFGRPVANIKAFTQADKTALRSMLNATHCKNMLEEMAAFDRGATRQEASFRSKPRAQQYSAGYETRDNDASMPFIAPILQLVAELSADIQLQKRKEFLNHCDFKHSLQLIKQLEIWMNGPAKILPTQVKELAQKVRESIDVVAQYKENFDEMSRANATTSSPSVSRLKLMAQFHTAALNALAASELFERALGEQRHAGGDVAAMLARELKIRPFPSRPFPPQPNPPRFISRTFRA